jgi:hypothetical protein
MATPAPPDQLAATPPRPSVPPLDTLPTAGRDDLPAGRYRRLVATLTLTLAAAVACAAALAACGSGGISGGTTTGPDAGAGLRFAQCMRAHGVPNFPDPSSGVGFQRGSGIDAQSPAFQTAQTGCIHILKAGGSRPAPTAAERAALLTFARCMRAHRVPNFPDPVTSLASRNTNVLVQGGMMFPVGSTIDPQSPAFQQAAAACGQGRPSGQPKGG